MYLSIFLSFFPFFFHSLPIIFCNSPSLLFVKARIFLTGLNRFPGRVMHSHDFRDAKEFEGKNLLVVGSSYSAEDLAMQTVKYGAKSVICSYR